MSVKQADLLLRRKRAHKERQNCAALRNWVAKRAQHVALILFFFAHPSLTRNNTQTALYLISIGTYTC